MLREASWKFLLFEGSPLSFCRSLKANLRLGSRARLGAVRVILDLCYDTIETTESTEHRRSLEPPPGHSCAFEYGRSVSTAAMPQQKKGRPNAEGKCVAGLKKSV